jgi:acetyl-CoA dehydrogenase-like protein
MAERVNDLLLPIVKGVGSEQAYQCLTESLQTLNRAEIALNALAGEVSDRDHAFYTGKVAVAEFSTKSVLPRLTAERKIVEAVDLTAMDLREEAF